MEKLQLIYNVDSLLRSSRHPVSRKLLENELECSKSTVNRLLQYMRDMFGAPIEYDRKQNGYYYPKDKLDTFQLPGLWFNAAELHALLTVQKLLADLQPGLLDSHIKPLHDRIEKILAQQKYQISDIQKRVRIFQKAVRPMPNRLFQQISTALLERKQIDIHYHSRGSGEETQRLISPQRMVYYNNNWYLDAWCHTRQGLRTFSIDRMKNIKQQKMQAKEIDDTTLDAHFSASYGIFSGAPSNIAKLRFSATQARWVKDEQWHPQQEATMRPDGRYELAVPYNDPQELIMDILKYGAEVEVLAPDELRQQVKGKILQMQKIYD